MKKPGVPANEIQRLEVLEDLEILDTSPEEAFDEITRIAAFMAQTPISLVSLVDETRQWFKSHHGLDATETPRELAFCAHVVECGDAMVVPDAHADERFADNPLVAAAPHVRFYAGTPLRMHGVTLGTLCVIDHEPRELDDERVELLHALGRRVVKELELRRHLIRVHRSAASTREELEQLEDTNRQKSFWLAAVAHDLRTPITALKGGLDLTLSGLCGELPDRARQLLTVGQTSCNRLMRMVNDTLDVEKLDAGIDLVVEEFELAGWLAELVESLLPTAEQKGVTLEVDCRAERVLADADRFAQILINLLGNAIKFTADGSTVRVTAEETVGRTRVAVRDAGPGIPEEQQERIFGRFTQLDAGLAAGGTGLGLAIAKRLVDAHGGEISVVSGVGEGAEFRVELPLSQ